MNFYKLIIFIASYLAFASALADQDDGSNPKPTTTSATYVWITTTVGGQLATISVPYSQSFIQTYSTANMDGVQSGSAGLGSISGSLSSYRSYSQTTVSNPNDAPGQNNFDTFYTGVLGGFVVMLGLL
ncbi:putative GPI-anchored protein 1 [Candida viswanathii]|uniref:Putative GPI-anchored protein 1 n=1 Tax=Candida viswanathii TaxID=5486 RepID=A0A367YKF7_9ASCO|nr:putative GPI-anchored protein 1 [Candida viswanathii]